MYFEFLDKTEGKLSTIITDYSKKLVHSICSLTPHCDPPLPPSPFYLFSHPAHCDPPLPPSPSTGSRSVVLVRGAGAPAEAGTLQVCANADASVYGNGCGAMQVGYFLRKSARRGLNEDGEEVVLAGRILVPAPASLEEELESLQVDRLAKGMWDPPWRTTRLASPPLVVVLVPLFDEMPQRDALS
jgi:hypothetical protein